MQEIGKFDVKISIRPNRFEQYMAFITDKNLVFVGIMQFMNSSLNPLKFSDNEFNFLSQEFTNEFLRLVKQKAVYLYEYMNSFKKLKRCLIDVNFFSSLKDKCISEKDYLHAIDVWIMFKMSTMGDYHDLYLKTDVLLLANVFEKFSNTFIEYYGLDPCH